MLPFLIYLPSHFTLFIHSLGYPTPENGSLSYVWSSIASGKAAAFLYRWYGGAAETCFPSGYKWDGLKTIRSDRMTPYSAPS